MHEPFESAVIFREAQQVMAALTSELIFQLDPSPWLLRDDLADQQDASVAVYLLLKTVIIDLAAATQTPLPVYLADLGGRVARRVEGLAI